MHTDRRLQDDHERLREAVMRAISRLCTAVDGDGATEIARAELEAALVMTERARPRLVS